MILHFAKKKHIKSETFVSLAVFDSIAEFCSETDGVSGVKMLQGELDEVHEILKQSVHTFKDNRRIFYPNQ